MTKSIYNTHYNYYTHPVNQLSKIIPATRAYNLHNIINAIGTFYKLPCMIIEIKAILFKPLKFFIMYLYLHVCDLSREKGPYAEIINFEKTAFFEMLQKFVDFYIYTYLRSTTAALQVDVFAFARNALVCEIWPRKDR